MRFNTRPFENLNKRLALQEAMAKAKTKKVPKAPPKYPLIEREKLMYDYDLGGVRLVDTGEYFTGKFEIPADKFVREVKVAYGQEVSNLIKLNTGEKFYCEVVGHEPKYFKTNLSEAEKQAQIAKMLEADQKIYDELMARFTAKHAQ